MPAKASERRTIFLNINRTVIEQEEVFYVAASGTTRFLVDKIAEPERVACVEVPWVIGEGL